jgi:5-methylthioadenosine/S-adenosylhomocysteine deaminase
VNPLGNLVHTGQGRDVRLVMVAGDILVEEGLPTRVDMEAVCAEAEAATRELWGEEGKRYWERVQG